MVAAGKDLWANFRRFAATLIRRDETPAFASQKAVLLELSHAMAACYVTPRNRQYGGHPYVRD